MLVVGDECVVVVGDWFCDVCVVGYYGLCGE